MAEQNRKTTEQKLWRKRAEQTVEHYLDWLFCDQDGQSIAREGRSMMGIWSDFHGDIPKSSGFSGFCTLASKVDRMRVRHATEQMIRARDAMMALSGEHIDALCIDRFYRGKTKVAVDPFTEKRIEIRYDDGACAAMLSVSVKTMHKRVSRGYQVLESVLRSDKLAA